MSDTLDKKFKALADKNRLKILLYLKRGNKILEAEEIIYSYRTKGYYVSEDIQKKKEEFGKRQVKHLVYVLHKLGYSDIEIQDMLKTVIKK